MSCHNYDKLFHQKQIPEWLCFSVCRAACASSSIKNYKKQTWLFDSAVASIKIYQYLAGQIITELFTFNKSQYFAKPYPITVNKPFPL